MRSYSQLCAVSNALDVIGGRWTLLIVRELLLEPRRFSDLRAALPGIATNLLAERLRELEAEGILARRTLDGPGDVQVYALTERGQALDEVVFALMRWGADTMAPQPGDFFRPEWLALVLRAYLPRTVPRDTRVRVRLQVGPAELSLDASDGTVRISPRAQGAEAEVTIEADPHALLGVASGAERLGAARRRGVVSVRGPREQAARVDRLFATISPR